MNVESTDLGAGIRAVRVTGEVDLYSAPEFKQELARALRGGSTRLLVDLSATSFIDSTALAVLVATRRQLQPAGGELVVVCADERLRKVFAMTNLDRTFELFPTSAQAEAHLRAGLPADAP